MEKIVINTEFIKLDQLLKFASIASTGGEAKFLIQEGRVKVNDEIVMQRGKKVKNEDVVDVDDEKFKIIYEK